MQAHYVGPHTPSVRREQERHALSSLLVFFRDHCSRQVKTKMKTDYSKNYWSFSFSISPSNEYSGLISFKMDWLDLLAVQGILKSLLQHHSSKASILWHSAFFIVQLSHPYMAAGKTTALTKWTFVGKVMSLLFNKLSRWSQLSSQGLSVFEFHGCSHHLQ